MIINTATYELEQYFNTNRLCWLTPKNDNDIIPIYNIYFNKFEFKLNDHLDNCEILYYYALYNEIHTNNKDAEKYYTLSVSNYNDNYINSPIYLQSIYKLYAHNKQIKNETLMITYMDKYLEQIVKSNIYNDFDINILTDMGKYFYNKKVIDKALKYYSTLYDLGKFDQDNNIYDMFNKYAEILFKKKDYIDSIEYYTKVIDFYDDTRHNKNILQNAYFKLATIYKNIDQSMTNNYCLLYIELVTSTELYDTVTTNNIIEVGKLFADEIELYEVYRVKAICNNKLNINIKISEIYKQIIDYLLSTNNTQVAITCLMFIITNNTDIETLNIAYSKLSRIYYLKGDNVNYCKYVTLCIQNLINHNSHKLSDDNTQLLSFIAKLFTYHVTNGDNIFLNHNQLTNVQNVSINITMELIDNMRNYLLSCNIDNKKFIKHVYDACGDVFVNIDLYENAEMLYNIGNLIFPQEGKTSNYAKIYIKKGYSFVNNNQIDSAIKSFKQAIECKNFDCANSLGLLYEKQNNFDLAEKYFNLAVSNNDFNCITNLCSIYKQNNNYDNMVFVCNKALQHNYIPAIKLLSDIYLEYEKVDEAFELYKKYPTEFCK
jgi:hypothetical protein